MQISAVLVGLAGTIWAANGQLLAGRASIPGVIALPYTKSTALLQKRDGFVDLSFGALHAPYIVNITVGTPPQPVTLSLDTGSSDTILLVEESSFCIENAGYCPSVGYYNANKSSSYKYLHSDFTANFGFAEQGRGSGASGDVATDTVSIAGAALKNQQFAIAYGTPTIAFSILGLGYAAGENQVHADPPRPAYNNFPLSLAAQGATNLALFSIWKDDPSKHDGQVLFGGVDTAKYTGDLVTLDTQHRKGFPNITAFDVLLNGLALSGDESFPKGSTGSAQVVLDCGTQETILPDEWVKPIHKQFNITYFSANDTAYVDCDMYEWEYTVEFTFQSLTIQVPIKRLVSLRALNPKVCTFGILPAGERHSLLGDNFLSSTFTVFDLTNNQISLAQRDFTVDEDKIVAVPAGGVKAIGSSTSTGPDTTTGSDSKTDPSGTSNPGATGTDANAAATSSDKSGASAVSYPAYLIGISLVYMLFSGLTF